MVAAGESAGQDERLRIESALIDLCLERSYAQVGLDDLLRRAEIDERAFAVHFEDLEDCFCSFYVRMRDEFMLRVGEAFLAQEGWQAQIRAAAWEIFDFIREDPGRARISFVEVWYAGERARQVREEAMQALFAMIDLGREESDAPVSPLTAEFVGSAVYQRLQEVIQRGETEGLESGVPELLYAVVLPYLGTEAAREEMERGTDR